MDPLKRALASLFLTFWGWIAKFFEYAVVFGIGAVLGLWYSQFNSTTIEQTPIITGFMLLFSCYTAEWCFVGSRATKKQKNIAFWLTVIVCTVIFAVACPIIGPMIEVEKSGVTIASVSFLVVLGIPAYLMAAIFKAICDVDPAGLDSDISVGRGQEEDDFSQLRQQHGPGVGGSSVNQQVANKLPQRQNRGGSASRNPIPLYLAKARWPSAVLSMGFAYWMHDSLIKVSKGPLFTIMLFAAAVLPFYLLRYIGRKWSRENYSLTAYSGWFHFDAFLLAALTTASLTPWVEYLTRIPALFYVSFFLLYCVLRYLFQQPLRQRVAGSVSVGGISAPANPQVASLRIAPTPLPRVQAPPPTTPPVSTAFSLPSIFDDD